MRCRRSWACTSRARPSLDRDRWRKPEAVPGVLPARLPVRRRGPAPERRRRHTTPRSRKGRAESRKREPRAPHGRISSTSWSYSCPYCLRCGSLESRGVGLAGADAHGVIQIEDKDLSVADLSGLRGIGDGADDLVDLLGVHCHFDLDLGQKAHRILGPTVDFRVPFLTPVSLGLGNGHPLHAYGGQSVSDLVELEGFDNGHDDFHGFDPRLGPFVWSHSAGGFTGLLPAKLVSQAEPQG